MFSVQKEDKLPVKVTYQATIVVKQWKRKGSGQNPDEMEILTNTRSFVVLGSVNFETYSKLLHQLAKLIFTLGACIQLRVWDQGCGISVYETIFQ
jgi:hypothetical protein